MKIVALGDQEAMIGLRLAGIDEIFKPETKDDAISLLFSLKKREDVGVIVISSDFYRQTREAVREIREESIFPLIVDIPTRQELEERT
jgi:vacuolar-type H+-ATPase subunit F/Vma7